MNNKDKTLKAINSRAKGGCIKTLELVYKRVEVKMELKNEKFYISEYFDEEVNELGYIEQTINNIICTTAEQWKYYIVNSLYNY